MCVRVRFSSTVLFNFLMKFVARTNEKQWNKTKSNHIFFYVYTWFVLTDEQQRSRCLNAPNYITYFFRFRFYITFHLYLRAHFFFRFGFCFILFSSSSSTSFILSLLFRAFRTRFNSIRFDLMKTHLFVGSIERFTLIFVDGISSIF